MKRTKKAVALLLAATMTLGMSFAAFATDVTYTATTAKDNVQTITKTYTSDESFIPTEGLSFTITSDSSNPDTPAITVGSNRDDKLSVGGTTKSYNLPINLPSYDTAGVYRYTVTEDDKGTAGVTYDTTKTIHVIVMVEYDNTNKALKIGNVDSYIEKIDGTKTDSFANKYDTGDVSVSKTVTGNMANQNDSFTVNYTLSSTKPVKADVSVAGTTVAASSFTKAEGATAYTYTGSITISQADGAKTFANLPKDMTVSITENTATDKMGGYSLVGYKVDDKESSTTAPTVTVTDGGNNSVVITNKKGTEISTGVTLDSAPYIVVAVVAVLGLALVVSKRNRLEK